MKTNKFIKEIDRLFQIAFIQKAFRMVLRSAWLAGAIYLLFWGLNQLFGMFPNQTVWVVFAVLTAVANLVSLYFRRQPDDKFVWQVDRRFNLKEQAVTAFELAGEGKSEPRTDGEDSLASMLAEDAAEPLPKIRWQVVSKGWNLRPEFESTLVVLILLLIVYLNGVSIITQVPPGGMIGILPGLGNDPTAEQVFAAGNSGAGNTPLGQGQINPIGENTNPTPLLDLTVQDYEIISDILSKLGQDLEDNSITNQLGLALQNEDYNSAAEEFGNLAETIARVSEETRNQLAADLLETAVELQNAGQNDLSQYFQDAASALYGDSFPQMSEALDQLGEVMDFLSQYQSQQMLVQMESDQAMVLEAVGGTDEPVQVPGDTSLPISEGESQDLDLIVPSTENVDVEIWPSYDLLLEDVDVVSSYFSSR